MSNENNDFFLLGSESNQSTNVTNLSNASTNESIQNSQVNQNSSISLIIRSNMCSGNEPRNEKIIRYNSNIKKII
jgi:hypothetical protein